MRRLHVENLRIAWKGELEAPYVTVYEGSIPNEAIARRTGGYRAAAGRSRRPGTDPQPVPSAEWQRRLAPGAATAIAIGTCATWGGTPANAANPTGAMGLMDLLGEDYRSASGLPVIDIPGCAPQGDNFTETVVAIRDHVTFVNPFAPDGLPDEVEQALGKG